MRHEPWDRDWRESALISHPAARKGAFESGCDDIRWSGMLDDEGEGVGQEGQTGRGESRRGFSLGSPLGLAHGATSRCE